MATIKILMICGATHAIQNAQLVTKQEIYIHANHAIKIIF